MKKNKVSLVEKIEEFLDEMHALSRSDPQRVMDIMRAFGGLLLMADMMRAETEANMALDDPAFREEIMAKIHHLFRDDDDLPN